MSQAEALLNSLSTTSTAETKEYVVIGSDRFITVPDSLKKLGVSHDHGVNTLTFKGPRYSENGKDLSTMNIWVNFMRADEYIDATPCENVTVDSTDEDTITFDWNITRNVTEVHGDLTILVCAKKADSNGDEVNHWNTELCDDFYVSEGMEVEESILSSYPDVIEYLLLRMTAVENKTTQKVITSYIKQYLDEDTSLIINKIEEIVANQPIQEFVENYLDEAVHVCTTTETIFTNSKEGLYEMVQMAGTSEQSSTNGYQLFDASKLNSKTEGGVKITNNDDGSFTVEAVDGATVLTGTGAAVVYDVTGDEAKSLFNKAGDYHLSLNGSRLYPYFYMNIYNDEGMIREITQDGAVASLTYEDITSEGFGVRFGFWGQAGSNIVSGTIKPLVYFDGDGTWESFSGGIKAPNPYYSQEIKSSCMQMKLAQGYWNSVGKFVTGNGHVTNYTPIPCESGDVITVTVENELENLSHRCFASDGTLLIANSTQDGNTYTFTIPDGGNVFYFILVKTGLTPETVKNLEVKINGKYITTIKTFGKNLLNPSLAIDKTTSGITFAVNKDKSITINGTATGSIYYEVGLITLKPGTYIFSGSDGGSNNTYLLYLQHPNSSVGYTHVTDGEKTFTITEPTIRKVLIAVYNGATVSNVTISPMISETGGTYEPYTETDATALLDEPLRRVGDISDCICKKDNTWGVERRWKKNTLDAADFSEITWTEYDNVTFFSLPKPEDSLVYGQYLTVDAMCTNFRCDTVHPLDQLDAVGNINTAASAPSLWFGFEKGTALVEAQSIGTFDYIYQLAEPTWEELPIECQDALDELEIYDGITYLEVTSDVEPIVTSRYGTSRLGARVITNSVNNTKIYRTIGNINIVLENLVGGE